MNEWKNNFTANQVQENLWNKKITQVEGRYLAKIFSFAFLIFIVLGGLVTIASAELSYAIATSTSSTLTERWYILMILVLPLGLAMMFISLYWRKRVETASWWIIGINYVLTLLFYGLIFTTVISSFNIFDTFKEDGFKAANLYSNLYATSAGYVLLSFGTASGIFLILAVVGWFISNKAAMTLWKVLLFTVILSFIFMIVLLIAGIFGFGRIAQTNNNLFSGINILFLVLFGLIAIISSILSVYKIKKTVPFIDFDNKKIVNKWKAYHSFEILENLLYLSYWVLRIVGSLKR